MMGFVQGKAETYFKAAAGSGSVVEAQDWQRKFEADGVFGRKVCPCDLPRNVAEPEAYFQAAAEEPDEEWCAWRSELKA
jgi:hypothetical protein